MSDTPQKLSIAEAFKKAGIDGLSSIELKSSPRAQATHDAVNNYLKQIQQARRATQNSTLKFGTRHHSRKTAPTSVQKTR